MRESTEGASEEEWRQKLTLLASMKRGQHCLASRLSCIIEEISTDDLDSLPEGLGGLFGVIRQVKNHSTGGRICFRCQSGVSDL